MLKGNTLNYRSVCHVSESARESLGVVAHGPSPHVFGQGSKHMAAARRVGDGFQHGPHLCCPCPGKSSSCAVMGVGEKGGGTEF